MLGSVWNSWYWLYRTVIDQGLHLSLQKLGELLGNYTCCTSCVVYILTSGLSPFLLAPKSGVGFVWNLGENKIYTDCICFLSILAKVVPQPSKNWFHCIAFHVEPCLVLWCFALLLKWWRCCFTSNYGVLTYKEIQVAKLLWGLFYILYV